jgi:formylglycine-generating enzyme required for sulfatase activity
MKPTVKIVLAIAACAWATGVRADVVIDTVTVGNPGNTGELSGSGAGGLGPDRICGAVDYVYDIGKFEITAGQFAALLNAVAAADTYGLYNPQMWEHARGCKIERSGSPGSYTYSVASDWAERPVNYVCWGDAARFANWLHNGQPTGSQDLSTTEDGAYYLDGATGNSELLAIVREPDATWVVPSEDEWHKAAYHKNDGVTGNYWDFPTGTDDYPSNDLLWPDPGNNANFYDGGFTIGTPYFRTEAGEFENSESPYGTFDQGGNVWEWNEAIVHTLYRGFRGGSFYHTRLFLQANVRDGGYLPSYEDYTYGFRVARIPQPIPGDLDGNGCVDQADLGILLGDWGCTGGDCAGDTDGDGDTDHADLGTLLAHWGEGCP